MNHGEGHTNKKIRRKNDSEDKKNKSTGFTVETVKDKKAETKPEPEGHGEEFSVDVEGLPEEKSKGFTVESVTDKKAKKKLEPEGHGEEFSVDVEGLPEEKSKGFTVESVTDKKAKKKSDPEGHGEEFSVDVDDLPEKKDTDVIPEGIVEDRKKKFEKKDKPESETKSRKKIRKTIKTSKKKHIKDKKSISDIPKDTDVIPEDIVEDRKKKFEKKDKPDDKPIKDTKLKKKKELVLPITDKSKIKDKKDTIKEIKEKIISDKETYNLNKFSLARSVVDSKKTKEVKLLATIEGKADLKDISKPAIEDKKTYGVSFEAFKNNKTAFKKVLSDYTFDPPLKSNCTFAELCLYNGKIKSKSANEYIKETSTKNSGEKLAEYIQNRCLQNQGLAIKEGSNQVVYKIEQDGEQKDSLKVGRTSEGKARLDIIDNGNVDTNNKAIAFAIEASSRMERPVLKKVTENNAGMGMKTWMAHRSKRQKTWH